MIHTRDQDFTLLCGDVLDELAGLPDESVHCVVTSPPYWGLRDYGMGSWVGGGPDCGHVRLDADRIDALTRGSTLSGGPNPDNHEYHRQQFRDVCGKCGAQRVDQQLGLEPTPEQYVARMVEVFREVRRVLRADGTCWVNLGDSYANPSQPGGGDPTIGTRNVGESRYRPSMAPGLKPKDLCGIPWRVAFALQADGWYLRSDIIWAKPNPMPESVTDRPTKAHEYVFLLTKSPRYFFDQEAVREAYRGPDDPSTFKFRYGTARTMTNGKERLGDDESGRTKDAPVSAVGRNVRSVWDIATQPYPEAHFATYPEELVRRCVLAGSSEHGCCPVCGEPWERDVEISLATTTRTSPPNKGRVGDFLGEKAAALTASGWVPNREKTVTTLGWRPGCDHQTAPMPCTVLDPFLGSGTTAYVARKHGRKSIGIELNPEYADLAAKRMQQQSLLV